MSIPSREVIDLISNEYFDAVPTGPFSWENGNPQKVLIELVENRSIKSGKVLDLCCGTGTNASYLATKGFSVVGVDLSSPSLNSEESRKSGTTENAFNPHNLEIPFNNEEFDFVYDLGCFDYAIFFYQIYAAKEIHRVLKKGGLFLLEVLSEKSTSDWDSMTQSKFESYFSDYFYTKLVKHFPSIESDGTIRYYSAFLLEKK